MVRFRGILVAIAMVLGACAGDSETERERKGLDKPVNWDCECFVDTHADQFGAPVPAHWEADLMCASEDPSDDDCACEATETRCEPEPEPR